MSTKIFVIVASARRRLEKGNPSRLHPLLHTLVEERAGERRFTTL